MNFLDTIFASARRVGDRPLTLEIHGKAQRPTTGNQLLALVASARGHLRASGVKPGDRVALLAPNSSRWVAAEKWHPDQQGRLLDDGGYELRVPYSQAPELLMDILRHGQHCEVIAPPGLREAVQQEHLSAARLNGA